MQTITLAEAQNYLGEIIEKLTPGEEIVLTRDDKPVATLRSMSPTCHEPPRFGTLKGSILHIAPDFEDIPKMYLAEPIDFVDVLTALGNLE